MTNGSTSAFAFAPVVSASASSLADKMGQNGVVAAIGLRGMGQWQSVGTACATYLVDDCLSMTLKGRNTRPSVSVHEHAALVHQNRLS